MRKNSYGTFAGQGEGEDIVQGVFGPSPVEGLQSRVISRKQIEQVRVCLSRVPHSSFMKLRVVFAHDLFDPARRDWGRASSGFMVVQGHIVEDFVLWSA